jgi:hypothetical protein
VVGLAVILSLLGVIWLIVYLNRRASLYFAFEDLAKRYLGKASNTIWGLPRAVFGFRDSTARIACLLRFRRRGGRLTRLQIGWPDRKFQLWLTLRPVPGAPVGPAGLTPYPLGEPGLDQRFTAWTNDPESCRQMLTPASLWHLVHLLELARHPHLDWRIRRGVFQISLGGHFRKKPQLVAVAEKMLEVYAQTLLCSQEGVDFIDDQSAYVIDAMVCPICSGSIGGDVAICFRCRTPHCKECWQYNGKCATFGCGSEKFVVPRARSTALPDPP